MPSVYPTPYKNNDRTTICNFYHIPAAQASGATGIPAVTINTFNQWVVDGCGVEQYNTTVSTAAMPTMSTLTNNGLNIDTITGASGKTIELVLGTNSVAQKDAYVAGTSSAFFTRATFNVNTLANVTSLYVGFRKVQTYQATLPAGYTDYAVFGISGAAGHLQSLTQAASGGNTTTDSTNTVTAGTNFTVQVNVSSSGAVTYLKDTTGNGPLIAPTTVAAYSFGAVTVIPYIIYTTVTSHSEVDLVNWTTGLL